MPISLLKMENALSRYQLETSGKLMRRRVSPVGAVSITTTSYESLFLNVRT